MKEIYDSLNLRNQYNFANSNNVFDKNTAETFFQAVNAIDFPIQNDYMERQSNILQNPLVKQQQNQQQIGQLLGVNEYINQNQSQLLNNYDTVTSDYVEMNGSGIFDTVLRVGKSLLGFVGPATRALDTSAKFIDSGSTVYNSVKNFNKPKQPRVTKKSVNKIIPATIVEEIIKS